MSNFIELGHCYLDVSSVAIVEVVTMQIVMKSGYVIPRHFFTRAQIEQVARLIRASNEIYHEESLLFLHSSNVVGEIEKFMAFMEYNKDFRPQYEKKNDRIYTLSVQGKSQLVKWVRHFNQSDNLSHILQGVQDLYEVWGGNDDEDSAEGVGDGGGVEDGE